jgi:hypothetical protein
MSFLLLCAVLTVSAWLYCFIGVCVLYVMAIFERGEKAGVAHVLLAVVWPLIPVAAAVCFIADLFDKRGRGGPY